MVALHLRRGQPGGGAAVPPLLHLPAVAPARTLLRRLDLPVGVLDRLAFVSVLPYLLKIVKSSITVATASFLSFIAFVTYIIR